MAAHNLTDIYYEQLLLFIIAVKLRPMVLWYTPSLRDRIRFADDKTPSLPAMKPEEVQLMFAARINIFDPISGQPTNNDLMQLREELALVLLPLPYNMDNGIHNLMGLVMDEDDYKVRYDTKFPNTTRPAVYDEDISNNATNLVRAKAEAVRTAKIADYQIFAAAEHKTRDFILAVIVDTWVRKKCEPITLYTAVSPSWILSHLQVLCCGIHYLDVLTLQNEMQHYHQDMEGIPEYVNALEDAQKRSKRSGNPIT